jgi:hypothetical protein
MPCPSEELVVEAVRFQGGEGYLGGKLAYTDQTPPLGGAVIVGPHPLLGGSMANNVVRALGDSLPLHRIATLRFDYRGVGDSEGPARGKALQLTAFWQTAHKDTEVEYGQDLAAANSCLCSALGSNVPLAFVGYSFGCSLLARPPSLTPATPLVLIAPTVGTHNYEAFASVPSPKLVIAPEDDFAVETRQLLAWYERLPEPKQLLRPRLDGHFFRGHEDWLATTVGQFLVDQLEALT